VRPFFKATNDLKNISSAILQLKIARGSGRCWERTRQLLSVFPDIEERYKEQYITFQRLWDGYSFAHSVGAVIVREFTDRNTLEQVITSNNTN